LDAWEFFVFHPAITFCKSDGVKLEKFLEASLRKTISNYLFLFVISGLIIAFDQWTKELVRTSLAFQETWTPWPWLSPYARFVNWHNTGVAFGMFQNMNRVFIVLSSAVSLGIIYFFPRVPHKEQYLRIALAMQLGGAVGNLIDRIARGYVTDFISIGSFAVFNVADSSISIGVVVLLLGMWIKEMQEKAKKPAVLLDPPQDVS
jgi:signal peptidase II